MATAIDDNTADGNLDKSKVRLISLSHTRQEAKYNAGDFPAKTFTKQEIGLKTPSSYRTIPIPDYVFGAILEERKVYEKNRRRRSGTFQDLDHICCSTYGRPRGKDFHWKHYKKLLEDNGLPNIRWHDLRSTFCAILFKE